MRSFRPFGWTGDLSPHEQLALDFTQSLPPGPLRAHLASLWAMYAHEQDGWLRDIEARSGSPAGSQQVKNMAERLALFEQHLREIATATRLDPHQARRIVENATKPKAPRVRREFKRKDQQ